MSAAALGTVLFHIVTVGTAPQPDEGAAAHIWQLLMAGQVPVVMFYAVTVVAGGAEDGAPDPRAAGRRRTRGRCADLYARLVTAHGGVSVRPLVLTARWFV